MDFVGAPSGWKLDCQKIAWIKKAIAESRTREKKRVWMWSIAAFGCLVTKGVWPCMQIMLAAKIFILFYE